ncbi:MAG: ribonuclease H-like domain-containing protein [Nitrospiraceae bacterium]|nr:ribonuclease H-like domain-containing protein [Nitrospiraceae bacterium]
MIRNTFSMLNGIGERLERRLWKHGILRWGDFLGASSIGFVSQPRKEIYDRHLAEAERRLSHGDSDFFAQSLRQREHWRLYEIFKGEALCLDIETNGWQPAAGGYVTVVGLYDGYDYRAYVKGNGLNAGTLEKEFSNYRYLITFFGSGFDMPFLKQSLGVSFHGAHFDLCFGARKLGLNGGLKRLEETLGIARDESVKGMDGYDAVKLWRHAKHGSRDALDLLVAYNRQDTVNLCAMAGIIYGKMKEQTGIGEFLN